MSDHSAVIDRTESLCPVCLAVIPAEVVERGGRVFLEKTCPRHGPLSAYLWPDSDHYRWFQAFSMPSWMPVIRTEAHAGCPLDCGLCGDHVKHPTVAEIEVTLRCNLRCPVCFMAAGDAPPDPSLETIESMFAAIRRDSGVQTAVQLTGGEPTVRGDLPEILRKGRDLGFRAIEVNTNGVTIGRDPGYIRALAQAGISGIYLQFDGLTRQVYQHIRGADLLETKLKAVEHCRRAGVQVVLAMTVIWGINHDQLGDVLRFALDNQDVIAGVAYQPAFSSGRFDVTPERSLTMGDVVFMLAAQSGGLLAPYDLWPLGCSHPLCSCATYIVSDHGNHVPFTRCITPEEYVQSFEPGSPQGSVFADIAAGRNPRLDHGLSVVVMNYMDAMTVDIKRLRECSMVEVMQDGRMIPFCAYQLSDQQGRRLYPAQGKAGVRWPQEKANA
jgi:uncharacterized radical SAM superfamily Fe-S cluster-containing enzyme